MHMISNDFVFKRIAKLCMSLTHCNVVMLLTCLKSAWCLNNYCEAQVLHHQISHFAPDARILTPANDTLMLIFYIHQNTTSEHTNAWE